MVTRDDRPRCPLCDQHEVSCLSGLARFTAHLYRICSGCGLLHADSDPTRERIFYQDVYPHLPHKRDEHLGRRAMFAEAADRLLRLQPGRRLLDVGCGTGEFLVCCQDHGFRPVGIDLSPSLVRRASVHCLPVLVGDVLALPFATRFDIVTQWNVLDHCVDPISALRQVAAILEPGGLLFLRVPNGLIHRPIMSVLAMTRGRLASALSRLTPLHPWLFRARDLERLLTLVGFERPTIIGSNPTGEAGRSKPLRARLGKRAVRVVSTGLGKLNRRLVVTPSLEVIAWKGTGRGTPMSPTRTGSP